MRSATECAPKTCKLCKHKLPNAKYDRPNPAFHSPFQGKVWFIACKCHILYIWGWHGKSNGCWKIRSLDPIFDTKEIVVVA